MTVGRTILSTIAAGAIIVTGGITGAAGTAWAADVTAAAPVSAQNGTGPASEDDSGWQ